MPRRSASPLRRGTDNHLAYLNVGRLLDREHDGTGDRIRRHREPVPQAPDAEAPLDAIAAGLQAVGAELQPRREAQRQRASIIAAHPELQERELIKQASWSAALADTLQQRGLAESAARLAAELAIAVLRVAFERWIDNANDRDLPQLITEALDQMELFATRE